MSVFTSLASESPFLPSHPGLVSSCWTGIHLPIVSLFCVWNPAVSVIRSQYSSVPVWIHFSSHPLAPGKRLPTWSPICAAWPVAPRFYSIVFAACGWLAPCKDHHQKGLCWCEELRTWDGKVILNDPNGHDLITRVFLRRQEGQRRGGSAKAEGGDVQPEAKVRGRLSDAELPARWEEGARSQREQAAHGS